MRAVFSLLFALGLFAGGALAQTQVVKTGSVVTQDNRLPGHEPDTYRFGIAYISTRGTTPGQCEAACNRDTQRCASWTLVPATFQMGPRCELKRNIGAQQYRPGAVSGIALRYQPKGNELQQAFERRSAVPQPRATYRPATPAPQPVATSEVPIRRAPTSPSTSTVMTAPSGPVPELRGAPPPPPSRPVNLTPAPMDRPIPPIRVAPEPSMPAPAPQQVQPAQPERPPQFEMQPSSATPAPVPQPSPAPTRQIQPIRRSVPVPAPSPEPAAPQPAAQPAPVATVPVEPSSGVQIDPPPPPIQPRNRTPWNERTGAETDYSVGDMDIIPGDEEATAGFIGGVPEE